MPQQLHSPPAPLMGAQQMPMHPGSGYNGSSDHIMQQNDDPYLEMGGDGMMDPQALRAVERWLALAPIDITYTNSSGRRLGLFRRNDGFEVDLGLMGDGCPPVPPSNGSVPLGY